MFRLAMSEESVAAIAGSIMASQVDDVGIDIGVVQWPPVHLDGSFVSSCITFSIFQYFQKL